MASVGMGPHRRAGRHHHLIQHWLGAEGKPRRYADYLPSDTPPRHNFTELPRIRSERPAFELHYPHMAARIDLPCGFRTVANGFAMPRAAFFCTLARSR